jgi:hypothetical protein
MELRMEESVLDARELDLAKTFLDSDVENPSSGNSLKNPLHFALSISPMYLLMPMQLVKTRVGRKNLLTVSWHSLCLKKMPIS